MGTNAHSRSSSIAVVWCASSSGSVVDALVCHVAFWIEFVWILEMAVIVVGAVSVHVEACAGWYDCVTPSN